MPFNNLLRTYNLFIDDHNQSSLVEQNPTYVEEPEPRPGEILSDVEPIEEYIKRKEGFRAKAEVPRGDTKITIGYGFTDPDIIAKFRNREMTPEEAEPYYQEELAKRRKYLARIIPTWSTLNKNQQDALLSYCYNTGLSVDGNPKLLAAIANRNWNEAARQMDRGLHLKGLKGLIGRRREEQERFLTPVRGDHSTDYLTNLRKSGIYRDEQVPLLNWLVVSPEPEVKTKRKRKRITKRKNGGMFSNIEFPNETLHKIPKKRLLKKAQRGSKVSNHQNNTQKLLIDYDSLLPELDKDAENVKALRVIGAARKWHDDWINNRLEILKKNIDNYWNDPPSSTNSKALDEARTQKLNRNRTEVYFNSAEGSPYYEESALFFKDNPAVIGFALPKPKEQKRIIVYPTDSDHTEPDNIIHELTHASNNIYAERAIKDLDPENHYRTDKPSYEEVYEKYFDQPNEIYARLQELRYSLGLKPTDVIKKEDLKRFRESEKVNLHHKKSLLNRYDDDFLLRLFNEVAQNSSLKDTDVSMALKGKRLIKKGQYGLFVNNNTNDGNLISINQPTNLNGPGSIILKNNINNNYNPYLYQKPRASLYWDPLTIPSSPKSATLSSSVANLLLSKPTLFQLITHNVLATVNNAARKYSNLVGKDGEGSLVFLDNEKVIRIDEKTPNIGAIYGNDMAENKNNNNIQTAYSFTNKLDTLIGNSKVGLSRFKIFWGVQDGKLVAGELPAFNSETEIVPVRNRWIGKIKEIIHDISDGDPEAVKKLEDIIKRITNTIETERNKFKTEFEKTYKGSPDDPEYKEAYEKAWNNSREKLVIEMNEHALKGAKLKINSATKHEDFAFVTQDGQIIPINKAGFDAEQYKHKMIFSDEAGHSVFVNNLYKFTNELVDLLNDYLSEHPLYAIMLDNGRFLHWGDDNLSLYLKWDFYRDPSKFKMYIFGTEKKP